MVFQLVYVRFLHNVDPIVCRYIEVETYVLVCVRKVFANIGFDYDVLAYVRIFLRYSVLKTFKYQYKIRVATDFVGYPHFGQMLLFNVFP